MREGGHLKPDGGLIKIYVARVFFSVFFFIKPITKKKYKLGSYTYRTQRFRYEPDTSGGYPLKLSRYFFHHDLSRVENPLEFQPLNSVLKRARRLDP